MPTTVKFRRLVAPATDGTYVPPIGGTWPFFGYEFINKDPTLGDQAPMDTSLTGSMANNPGSFFVAFQDDASSSFANRPHWALSMNTDVIDDQLHYPMAMAATRVATTGSGGYTIVLTSGWIWCGDGDDTDPDDFIRITVRYAATAEQDIFFLDGTTPHRAKCIDMLQDSSSIVEAGMIEASPAHPVTLVFDCPVIFEVWLYYATRASLARDTRAAGGFVRHMLRPSELSFAAMDILGRIINTSGMDLSAPVPISLADTVTALAGKGGKAAINTWTMLNVWQNETRFSQTESTDRPFLCWSAESLGGSGHTKMRFYRSKHQVILSMNASCDTSWNWTADDTTRAASATMWDDRTGRTELSRFDTAIPWVTWDDNTASSNRGYRYTSFSGSQSPDSHSTPYGSWRLVTRDSSTAGLQVFFTSARGGQTIDVVAAVGIRNPSAGSGSFKTRVEVQYDGINWVAVPGTLRTIDWSADAYDPFYLNMSGTLLLPGDASTTYVSVWVRVVDWCDAGTNLLSNDCYLRATVEQVGVL